MNALEKLRYSKNKKVLMVHADDAGLSHSENKATIKALQFGIVSSYSIMIPCQDFDEIKDFALRNPQFDYGIHLTLTCEWKHYKFGPVSPVDEVPSLVDVNGHFYKTRELFKNNAKVSDIEKELEAQIEKALDTGLQPSHLDCHMFSLGVRPDFLSVYKKMGEKYNLSVLLSVDLLAMVGADMANSIHADDLVVDKVYVGDYQNFKDNSLKQYYIDTLNRLDPGLNILLIHPAYDDDEMRTITEDHPNFGSEWRQLDLDFFTSEKCRSVLEKQEIELISWTQISNYLQ